MSRKLLRCPVCGHPVPFPEDRRPKPPFPFCSERCRLIDLGRWLGERYRLPAVEADESDLSDSFDPPEKNEADESGR